MTQYILVYIIIAASIIYICYRVYWAVSDKKKGGCTGHCANCPFAEGIKKRKSCHR